MAISTSYFISRINPLPESQSRISSIDGLRGYLALFVFISHASNWYLYIRTGDWKSEPSHLYTHLGQSSVTFFFMITAFLFYSKILEQKQIDWARLFVSRVLRLTPLYLFSISILALIIANLSNWTLNVPLFSIIKDLGKWASFSILGKPDVNGIPDTTLILAGVTWSLPYEWFFYAALPILSLTTGKAPPKIFLISGWISIAYFYFWKPNMILTLPFLGGIAAALLAKSSRFCAFAKSRAATFIALSLIAGTVNYYPTAHSAAAVGLLSIAFSIFACGNTLFNTLTSPASRWLGEIAYSIYLLHGILLFTTFNFLLNIKQAASFYPYEHWIVIICITPPFILLCYCTFKFIEAPAMRSVSSVMQRIRITRSRQASNDFSSS
jgi:peptidoglycan/LPS O-acetylase OafA/YrhL